MSIFSEQAEFLENAGHSVNFDLVNYQGLADAYADTAEALDATGHALTQLMHRAQHLLTHHVDLSAPRSLIRSASELNDERTDMRRRLAAIQETDARTAFLLAISKERLINVELAADALHMGWTYDEASLHHELREFQQSPRPLTAAQHQHVAALQSELAALARPHSFAGVEGDLDSDFHTPRIGSPLRFDGSATQAADRGRDLVERALSDVVDLDQIQRDEFEVFFHDNGNLTFVLPGVIDLLDLRVGHDPETNSLRDFDQQAMRSTSSTQLRHNGYAQRIAEWTEEMIAAGVIARGAQTSIIGHSFGGDTAFDLAADERFNGELLTVTHTLATGYNSRSQLQDIPAHTQAVALLNDVDAVVIAERLFEGATSLPSPGLIWPSRDRSKKSPATFGKDRITAVTPTGYLVEFKGGFDGYGHHPDEYSSYLDRSDDAEIIDFLSQLDTNGFTSDAVAASIDVSDPGADR